MEEVRTFNNWDEGREMLRRSQRPFGIIVICADPKTKNKFVYNTLEKLLSTICLSTEACSTKRLREILEESSVVCVSFESQEACDHARRHEIVTMLYRAGAQKVYGVYLRVTDSPFEDVRSAAGALESNPPTAEGLNGLIIL